MEVNTLAVAFISFVFGNISGYLLHKVVSDRVSNFDSEARMNFLIFVVSVVWLISVVVDIASPVYETSPMIHGIMGAIVGFFFYKPGQKNEDKK